MNQIEDMGLSGYLMNGPRAEPTEADLADPLFEAVWQAIKGWDIRRTPDEGYASATGTDVMTILRALRA